MQDRQADRKGEGSTILEGSYSGNSLKVGNRHREQREVKSFFPRCFVLGSTQGKATPPVPLKGCLCELKGLRTVSGLQNWKVDYLF